MNKVMNPKWYEGESDNLLAYGLVIHDGVWHRLNEYQEAVPVSTKECLVQEQDPWVNASGNKNKQFKPPVLADLAIYEGRATDTHLSLLRKVRAEFDREPLQALTDMLQELGSAERTEKRWRRGDVRFKGREAMQPKEVFGLFSELLSNAKIPEDWVAA